MQYMPTIVAASTSWWSDSTWPWLSDWVGTAGFGALVATVGVSITVSVSVRKNRHEVWWEQAEWALARYFNTELDNNEREASGRIVRVLLSSGLATPEEIEFLKEATLGMWAAPEASVETASVDSTKQTEHNGGHTKEGEG